MECKPIMKSVVVIPARYKSSRYPGKPLAKILGKPMILWVASLSAEAVGKSNVYIATEDRRIVKVVEDAGYQAVMTSDEALTGTDRVAEVAKVVDADIYINVQGDEPIIDPQDIKNILDIKKKNITEIINGFTWVSDSENPSSVNIPKVITTEDNKLVYMSRNLLPGYKESKQKPSAYKKQVCIYAFTKKELLSFLSFGRKSCLESSEDIEILRFLELGVSITMIETQPSLAVDVPEDVSRVENALRKKSVMTS